MASFKYRGRDETGNEVSGIIEATNENAVASALFAQKIIPVEIAEGELEQKISAFTFKEHTVSLDELVMLCRQLHSLLKAGIPTAQAINGLARSSRNPTLSGSLYKLEQSLEIGTTLAASLQQQPEIYSSLFVSMIHVGENTGHLDESFKKLSGYLELERITRQRLKQATRYPMMVISAIVLALVVMNMYVIPKFAQLFSKFGSELPLPTKILINTSDFFIHWWWVILLGLIMATTALIRYKKTSEGHLRWDRSLLKIPIVGPIFEKITLGRFARTFAMTYTAGLPILQALSVVSKAVANKFVEKTILDMRSGIERGESFARSSSATGLFSPLALQMIHVGEQTGSLDHLLNEVADFYEQEVDYDLKRLSDAIEPVLLLFMGSMVLVLALGIFLPMWDMFALIQK